MRNHALISQNGQSGQNALTHVVKVSERRAGNAFSLADNLMRSLTTHAKHLWTLLRNATLKNAHSGQTGLNGQNALGLVAEETGEGSGSAQIQPLEKKLSVQERGPKLKSATRMIAPIGLTGQNGQSAQSLVEAAQGPRLGNVEMQRMM